MQWLVDYLNALWMISLVTAPYLLGGLLISGLIKAGIPQTWFMRVLGGRGPLKVIAASFIGAPLPLCSCGVLPVAMTLRRQGASRASTSAFLISTPETGVDSVAISYTLLGPFFAIARPIIAIFGALMAGTLVALFGPPEEDELDEGKEPALAEAEIALATEKVAVSSCCASSPKVAEAVASSVEMPAPLALSGTTPFSTVEALTMNASQAVMTPVKQEAAKSCCSSSPGKPDPEETVSSCCSSAKAEVTETKSSCCGTAKVEKAKAEKSCCGTGTKQARQSKTASSCCSSGSTDSPQASAEAGCCASSSSDQGELGYFGRLKEGIAFSFGGLLDDMFKWLILGIVLAAMITAFVPQDLLASISEWGFGIPLMLLILVIGVPMYICAASSTPLAAGLLFAGLSPGAAIVFLSAGPATNIAGLAVIRKELGLRATALYLTGAIISTLIAGLVVNQVIAFFPNLWSIQHMALAHHHHHHGQGVDWFYWISVVALVIIVVCGIKPLRQLFGKVFAMGRPAIS